MGQKINRPAKNMLVLICQKKHQSLDTQGLQHSQKKQKKWTIMTKIA